MKLLRKKTSREQEQAPGTCWFPQHGQGVTSGAKQRTTHGAVNEGSTFWLEFLQEPFSEREGKREDQFLLLSLRDTGTLGTLA